MSLLILAFLILQTIVLFGASDEVPITMTLGTLRALIRDLPDDTPVVAFKRSNIDGDWYAKASIKQVTMKHVPSYGWVADRHGVKVVQVY